ncbi:Beta-lactamase-like domain-containing protein [Aphelenchoides bicaudatus]|nr:Beta-lactamase-like domain-containing protein [Aphelenchoides bicaudatus]
MQLIFVFALMLAMCEAGRSRKNREWRQLRPSCGSLESTIQSYPRYPQFPPPVRFPELFPFPFYARKGFRGLGIPDSIIDRRLGKPCQGPVIEPLSYGKFSLNNDTLRASAGITLITDEKRSTNEICLILVDTGSASRRMDLLKALSAVGVMPEYINNLVLTHLDLDTVGNMNLFPEANIYVGNRRSKAETVYFPKMAPSFDQNNSGLPFTQLCDNTFVSIFLYLTPGFTNEDISVVVKNVADFGTVAVTGNLILDEEDLQNTENAVKRFSQNNEQAELWNISRKEILAIADFVIPGYGQPFNVTNEMKLATPSPSTTIQPAQYIN